MAANTQLAVVGEVRDVTEFAEVYVFTAPVPMYLGIDGLSELIRKRFGSIPRRSGQMFLFISGDRKRAKALLIDNAGVSLLYRRMKPGNFFPDPTFRGESASWTRDQLMQFINSPVQKRQQIEAPKKTKKK